MKTALVLVGSNILFSGGLLMLGVANFGTLVASILTLGVAIGVAVPEALKI